MRFPSKSTISTWHKLSAISKTIFCWRVIPLNCLLFTMISFMDITFVKIEPNFLFGTPVCMHYLRDINCRTSRKLIISDGYSHSVLTPHNEILLTILLSYKSVIHPSCCSLISKKHSIFSISGCLNNNVCIYKFSKIFSDIKCLCDCKRKLQSCFKIYILYIQ